MTKYGGEVLKKLYLELKNEYEKYILLLKFGSFYVALEEDVAILNKIFGFKIKETNRFIKVGFPLNSLNKVTNILDSKNINYIVYDKEIKKKEKYYTYSYKCRNLLFPFIS